MFIYLNTCKAIIIWGLLYIVVDNLKVNDTIAWEYIPPVYLLIGKYKNFAKDIFTKIYILVNVLLKIIYYVK